jgi:uncharacterized protein (DUF1778 family)
MAASTAERGRITARVPAYAQQVIEQAAMLTATTTNQFVAQAALREAERVVRESQSIQLSSRDADRFFAALDNPPPVNERLAAALLKHLTNTENSKHVRSGTGSTASPLAWKPRPRDV